MKRVENIFTFHLQGFAINLSVCEGIHTITATIEMYKNFNASITKMLEVN
jgi:hypothetical protein